MWVVLVFPACWMADERDKTRRREKNVEMEIESRKQAEREKFAPSWHFSLFPHQDNVLNPFIHLSRQAQKICIPFSLFFTFLGHSFTFSFFTFHFAANAWSLCVCVCCQLRWTGRKEEMRAMFAFTLICFSRWARVEQEIKSVLVTKEVLIHLQSNCIQFLPYTLLLLDSCGG